MLTQCCDEKPSAIWQASDESMNVRLVRLDNDAISLNAPAHAWCRCWCCCLRRVTVNSCKLLYLLERQIRDFNGVSAFAADEYFWHFGDSLAVLYCTPYSIR